MQIISNSLPFILVFVSVALMVLGLGSLFFATENPLRRRLEIATPANEDTNGVRIASSGFYRAIVRPLQRYIVPPDHEQHSTVRLRLLQAGYASPTAPAVYYGARILLGFGLPLIAALLAPVLAPKLPTAMIIGLLGVCGAVGYILPSIVISQRVAARQQLARESFPDAMDMMLMCVEAGLGLDAAIVRVGEEIRLAHPMLAGHFDRLAAEIRVGKMRDEAYRAFADRIGIEEVNSFVALLVQSEDLGTNMADTLRSISEDMRQRRILRAEELAHKVSTKLSMILALVIIPVILSIVASPAAVTAYRNFRHIGH